VHKVETATSAASRHNRNFSRVTRRPWRSLSKPRHTGRTAFIALML